MVNPLNLPYSPKILITGLSLIMVLQLPPISFSTRKLPITNVNNTYEYNPSHNGSRRYSKNLAPQEF